MVFLILDCILDGCADVVDLILLIALPQLFDIILPLQGRDRDNVLLGVRRLHSIIKELLLRRLTLVHDLLVVLLH